MIIHIALFKWKNKVGKAEIENLLGKIKLLKMEIEGVREIFAGENYHRESKGFTHAVVVLAENQEALDNYRKHPYHKTIAEQIEEIEEDSLGFDFKA